MLGIKHIRVDDRLIHGQVATMWTNNLGVNRIMVINDEVANNPTQKSVLRMAAPANVATSIITRETAIKNIKSDKYKGQNVLILVKSPLDLERLIEEGLDIRSFNLGNVSSKSNSRVIRPSVSLTEEEISSVRRMLDTGVEITAQMTPRDKIVLIGDYL